MKDLNPIKWDKNLHLIDQRKLPLDESWVEVTNLEQTHDAIRDMVVRGAPCIGFTAIFGMALWARDNKNLNSDSLKQAAEYLINARPTAVNLKYEVNRCVDLYYGNINQDAKDYFETLEMLGLKALAESEEKNLQMAKHAQVDLADGLGIKAYKLMTHCNTGFLACGTLGTALGVVSHLASQKLVENVWVDETRPYLQGSRLTAYELGKQNINHKVVVEGSSSYLMREGLVDAIFVGADRIAMNGDTANKVGTSSLAIVANYYKIPFYVVAPLSSFDPELKSGSEIEIEMRDQNEILEYKGNRIAPRESGALNPSFDITPGSLVTKVICEKGAFEAGDDNALSFLFE